jgi:predicted glycosyltransferase
MRVWIDLANSPHVPLFEPVVERLRDDGHDVFLTARDHEQTVGLARRHWPDLVVDGAPSPRNRAAKGLAVARRAEHLRRFALRTRPDVALSHGSYAQVLAARAARAPVVTMMDYEHQPANHVSFRLAHRVIVPEVFPEMALRTYGARAERVLRYPGFKEELYVGRVRRDLTVLEELGLDPGRVIAVFRPPPDTALYHPMANARFDELLALAVRRDDVQVIVLPRNAQQLKQYSMLGAIVPERPIDGRSLLAQADLMVGAGGTMNRESALLATPTYTVFAGRLAAVDGELIRRGLLHDLRGDPVPPVFEKKPERPSVEAAAAEPILATILEALTAARRHRARS